MRAAGWCLTCSAPRRASTGASPCLPSAPWALCWRTPSVVWTSGPTEPRARYSRPPDHPAMLAAMFCTHATLHAGPCPLPFNFSSFREKGGAMAYEWIRVFSASPQLFSDFLLFPVLFSDVHVTPANGVFSVGFDGTIVATESLSHLM